MAIGNLFNEEWYLKNYPDVRAAVEAGLMDARTHFEQYGRFEGRSPDPLFNPAEYLAANPDVRAAVEAGTLTAYDHFVQFGATEGRSPTKLFDPAFYLSQNPDVRAAVEAGLISATEHFLLYGQGEPRQVNPFINLGDYLEANPDLKQAADDGLLSPLTHLLIHGAAESRDLGNGINLGIFANDPAYKAAIQSGDFTAAMGRVGEVAPFLPSFEPPAGWQPAPNTPIPTDFTPPEGTKLVIPPSVEVPDDMELPDTFEPVEPGPGPSPDPDPGDGGGGSSPGVTTTLSELAEDSDVEEVNGTARNDTFIAESSAALRGGEIVEGVLQSGLVLDGKGGTDTLKATLDESVDWPDYAPTIRSVENFVLTADAGKPGAKDDIGLMFTRITGVKSLVNKGSTSNLTATDVREKVILGVEDMEAGNPRDFAVRYGREMADIGTQNLTLKDAHVNLLTITKLSPAGSDYVSASAGIKTLDIRANGDNSIRSFDEGVEGGANLSDSLKTINVSGGVGSLDLHTLSANVTTVDASDYRGDLTVDMRDAVGADVKGGRGDDNITFGAGASVSGNAGNDTFVIAASAGSGQPTTQMWIEDYGIGNDTIDLSFVDNLQLNGPENNRLEIHQGGKTGGAWGSNPQGTKSDVLVQLSGGSGSQLIIEGVYDAGETVVFKITEKQAGVGAGSNVLDFLVNITENGVIDAAGYDEGVLLSGGGGSQTLISGKGNDILQGGKGDDVFHFDSQFGVDVILDYGVGADKIELHGISKDDLTVSNELTTVKGLSGGSYAAIYSKLKSFGLTDDTAITVVEHLDNDAIILIGNHKNVLTELIEVA